MSEHFEALEADFAREYPYICDGDLRSALWGENALGVRRLSALLRGMSPRSAVAREAYSEGKDWGNAEELLASIAEMIDAGNRIIYSAYSEKNAKVWKPFQVPRPRGSTYKKRIPPITGEKLARFFKRSSGRIHVDKT